MPWGLQQEGSYLQTMERVRDSLSGESSLPGLQGAAIVLYPLMKQSSRHRVWELHIWNINFQAWNLTHQMWNFYALGIEHNPSYREPGF